MSLDVYKRQDMEDEQQRVEFIHEAVRVLQKMNPVEADIYIKKLSVETGISEGAIRFEYTGNTSQDSGGSAHEAYDRLSLIHIFPFMWNRTAS